MERGRIGSGFHPGGRRIERRSSEGAKMHLLEVLGLHLLHGSIFSDVWFIWQMERSVTKAKDKRSDEDLL
jgi:hypothetical protein